jgi:hypothetical protein
MAAIPHLTLLIMGGYGTFGGRLVVLLEDEPRLTLIVAGRSLDRARAFCASRPNARAALVPALSDRDGDLGGQLTALHPDILIDASGPFQAYGPGQYRVVEACIAGGVNYLDLADGSDFVAGIDDFDAAARAAGLSVLSGVSSFPVLTAAAVRRLSADGARVEAIRGGIAPSPWAGVGGNVIRAIASYAGQPIPRRRVGATGRFHPFTEQRRFTIAPPGRLPLHNKMFSLVDVPDLHALAILYPEAKSVWMGAGPVPAISHRALIALAWCVRLGLLRSVLPLAPLMEFATRHLRWGEHRGGMFVEIEATDSAGKPVRRSWHLVAEGDDGPLIPSMAVAALVGNALDGRSPAQGARTASGELELEDYERLFRSRSIYSGVRGDAVPETRALYARVLGPAWDDLPIEIRALHRIDRTATASGRASVERGRSVPARLAAAVLGLPRAMADTPVTVRFEAAADTEIWRREFSTLAFSSRQFAGHGRSAGLLCERFGPLTFAMALVWREPCLSLVLRRWSCFGIPLPMWLAPRSTAFESVEAGRFTFHVEIGHPWTGPIVRYRGWLVPDQGAAAP